MASKSYKKTMAALAFSNMVANILIDRGAKGIVRAKAFRVFSACKTCLDIAPKLLTTKEQKRFIRNLNRLHDTHFSEGMDAIPLVSYAAFLISEPAERLQEGEFRDLVQIVDRSLSDIICELERMSGPAYAAIEHGNRIRRFWEGLEW